MIVNNSEVFNLPTSITNHSQYAGIIDKYYKSDIPYTVSVKDGNIALSADYSTAMSRDNIMQNVKVYERVSICLQDFQTNNEGAPNCSYLFESCEKYVALTGVDRVHIYNGNGECLDNAIKSIILPNVNVEYNSALYDNNGLVASKQVNFKAKNITFGNDYDSCLYLRDTDGYAPTHNFANIKDFLLPKAYETLKAVPYVFFKYDPNRIFSDDGSYAVTTNKRTGNMQVTTSHAVDKSGIVIDTTTYGNVENLQSPMYVQTTKKFPDGSFTIHTDGDLKAALSAVVEQMNSQNEKSSQF